MFSRELSPIITATKRVHAGLGQSVTSVGKANQSHENTLGRRNVRESHETTRSNA